MKLIQTLDIDKTKKYLYLISKLLPSSIVHHVFTTSSSHSFVVAGSNKNSYERGQSALDAVSAGPLYEPHSDNKPWYVSLLFQSTPCDAHIVLNFHHMNRQTRCI